jgi:hypothetical protein
LHLAQPLAEWRAAEMKRFLPLACLAAVVAAASAAVGAIAPGTSDIAALAAAMNQFEGCCEVAGSYYSITPKHKTTNDYTMLQALDGNNVSQIWAYLDPVIDWWRPCTYEPWPWEQ